MQACQASASVWPRSWLAAGLRAPHTPAHTHQHARGAGVVVDRDQGLDQRVRVQQHESAHELVWGLAPQALQLLDCVEQLVVRHAVVARLLLRQHRNTHVGAKRVGHSPGTNSQQAR